MEKVAMELTETTRPFSIFFCAEGTILLRRPAKTPKDQAKQEHHGKN